MKIEANNSKYTEFLRFTARRDHNIGINSGKLLLIAACAFIFIGKVQIRAQTADPKLLSFDELTELYEQKNPSTPLAEKLRTLLTTPFVDNGATANGVRPVLPQTKKLGKFVRVVKWNIERGLEFDAIKLAFTNPKAFDALIDKTEYPKRSKKRNLILQEAALLREADVIIFNEVAWGMKRSGYRNVAAELAAAMKMNYAYGVEFVEFDPIATGAEKFEELSPKERSELVSEISVDRARYKGLHGTAILRRTDFSGKSSPRSAARRANDADGGNCRRTISRRANDCRRHASRIENQTRRTT